MNKQDASLTSIPHRDIPWLLSKIALQELRRMPPYQRIDTAFWVQLKSKRPNLTDFLLSASYRIAPDDPELRGEVAAFGAELVYMLTTTETNGGKIRPTINKLDPEPVTNGDLNGGDESGQPAA